MKKVVLPTIIFISFCVVNIKAYKMDHSLIYNDLNTINFREKFKGEELMNIKKICSYDFCDYINTENITNSLDTFTKKYLDNIYNEDEKKMLFVKGIKITKVVFNN